MKLPSLAELIRVFTRIGLMSFGGPAAQIAVMHKELVEDRPWLTEDQFLRALSFCMLLPGPEAMQLCTYAGWRLRGTLGGLIAGLLFVLPGAAVMFALVLAYANWGNVPAVEALFLGIKATVVVVVLQALWRLGRKTLKRSLHWIIALMAFVALYLFGLPFPLVIVAAALFGALRAASETTVTAAVPARSTATLSTVAIWGALWAAPIALAFLLGADFLVDVGLFFSKLAVVSFGGAYAVLAYMAQAAVETEGWISAGQMVDGLGLAETTPGPLILVTQFVGFMAGYNLAGAGLAFAAGLMTLWATFVPCFLWIFTAAPHVEWLTSQPRLDAALRAITAAIVGVIANLMLWFAMTVFFAQTRPIWEGLPGARPDFASVDLTAVGLCALSAVLLARLSLPLTLICMALAGLGCSLVFT
ncbi:putative chromate transport protein [Aliiroseovarius pelagivivens]|uniref:Putative chromate transport protein n=1 Tax=Aliiroseovarius pelagivivens TaxID=1639690 RepID=A0A2R8AJK6_9RHOB|nr:chromate efflux transporter [Aliiroseovarius pelagivivens]SPF76054.1 putative chromate transport protein [Aliiroseovarius pelagivivens]